MEILKYSKMDFFFFFFTLICGPKIRTKLSQNKNKVKVKGENKHFNCKLFLNFFCSSAEVGHVPTAGKAATL